nr:MAG TPA: zinc-ribbon containing domain protein [Caudoviricetes sp.]
MTTEELNGIALRLRRTANDSLGGESLQKALARITKAPATDWRTVMRRIAELIDRPTCQNVYDESEYGACDNGFECSVCGCRVEDEEHYHVSGVWNFCPQCGKRVRPKNE